MKRHAQATRTPKVAHSPAGEKTTHKGLFHPLTESCASYYESTEMGT